MKTLKVVFVILGLGMFCLGLVFCERNIDKPVGPFTQNSIASRVVDLPSFGPLSRQKPTTKGELSERDYIMNNVHTLSWAYYTDCVDSKCINFNKWYISNKYDGNVYALTPIKNRKAGWATVGQNVAKIDLNNDQVTIGGNLDNDPSNRYNESLT